MNNLSGSLSFHGNVSGQMGANLLPSVEANPSGTATEILTSIRVGDIIYSIPSGGGGGGGTNDYNSLLNKPKINNVELSGELSLSQLGIQNPVTMTGASSSSDGAAGYVPKPLVADKDKFLRGDGIWSELSAGGDYEIIPIEGGDNTVTRTFNFTKQPKFIAYCWIDPLLENGWNTNSHFIWGQEYISYNSSTNAVAISNNYQGCIRATYAGNSVTFTGGNPFAACNGSTGSGYMFVVY